ncbi:DUF5677 domain-containing protein [Mesorhizobium sp. M0217]|uniref:DUF5677 domain-containing protein n=1 Tax=unclassified Mesorhizobium TaxID=325217 RepID=UPI0033358705
MNDFLPELFAATMDMLPQVVFNKGQKVHRTLIALYSTVIEQVDSAMILQAKGRSASLDIILRSCLEAYVDLVNLASDDGYMHQMEMSYHHEWVRLAKGADPDNPYLASVIADAESNAFHTSELARLAAIAPLMNTFERFKRAGMENEYRSVYNQLCSETHNNLRALIRRHFRFADDGDENKLELIVMSEMEEGALVATLHTFIAVLGQSNVIIHDYFKTNAQDRALDLRRRIEAIEDPSATVTMMQLETS